jgi:nitrate/nitrite transporter NarK
LAALCLVVVLPLNYALQRSRPEDLGLHPDGDATAVAAFPAAGSPADSGAGSGSERSVRSVRSERQWTLRQAAASAPFWWIGIGYFCGLFSWYAVQVHQTKYLIEIGISPDTAAYALGFVGLAGIAGQIGLGHISDRIGREWVWTIASVGYVVCYGLLLAMERNPSLMLVWAMVIAQGALGYGLASVYGAIPAEIFHGRSFGSIFGVISLVSTAGAGVGPWVAGVLRDWTGSYAPAWWTSIGVTAVSIACIWLSARGKRHAAA